MLEINVKPRRVTLEEHRRFKIGKDQWEWRWTPIRQYNSDKPFTDNELREMLSLYIEANHSDKNITLTQFGARLESSSVNGVRFISSKGNQLLSDKSVDFVTRLDTIDLGVACFRKDKNSVNEKIVYARSNPAFPSFESLQDEILKHGGIKNVRAYPLTEADSISDCYRIVFNDKTEMTFSMWCSAYTGRCRSL